MNYKKGFTLVELLVVIAIIGVLATIAVVAVNYARSYAKTVKAQHDIAQIEKTINMLADDSGTWPGHQEVNKIHSVSNNEICSDGCSYGLTDSRAGLVETDGSYNNWVGPYIENIPVDPWGNQYFFDTDYRVDTDGKPCSGGSACVDTVSVGSYGPDGVGNNQYNSDDIIKILVK